MKQLLPALLCAVALCAQEPISRVVQLRHIHPDPTQAVLDILAAGKVRWRTDGNLRIIAMHGPLELVEAMEAAIKKLDVPAPAVKNIEVTFHMLLASAQGDSPAIPPDLTGVAQQLRNVFGLKSIRVLETAVMRGREGRQMETSGLVALPVKVDATPQYNIRLQNVATSPSEKGLLVRIDKLEFRVSIPSLKIGGQGLTYDSASINTDVDVREGQKVVVGKSGLDATSQSVFLVVSAKVLD
ncbi:MAG: hypothetical protein ACKV2U_11895 [Bryobacteraceae bacterium]